MGFLSTVVRGVFGLASTAVITGASVTVLAIGAAYITKPTAESFDDFFKRLQTKEKGPTGVQIADKLIHSAADNLGGYKYDHRDYIVFKVVGVKDEVTEKQKGFIGAFGNWYQLN